MYSFPSTPPSKQAFSAAVVEVVGVVVSGGNVREIGDVDEGVVEGGEDTGYAEDELACKQNCVSVCALALISPIALAICGFVTYPRGPGDQAEHSLAHRARPSSWVPCLRCVEVGESAGRRA